ncbi:hypothetical protein [Paraburkholderia sp. C35]|uniref:hypothetical protein n=1 Tax=Paraburkholderia sp. C35 TaxID=2126993 RepID=UPI000D68FAFC|nr:hypothetical protein [Paraburkholderia sp. C35]
MSTATTSDRNSNTHTAAFPRTPENGQPRTAIEGDKRVVTLNGARIDMVYTGGGWVNWRVPNA